RPFNPGLGTLPPVRRGVRAVQRRRLTAPSGGRAGFARAAVQSRPGYSAPGPERCPSGLRSATGNRVWAERSIAGSNPALSASVEGPPRGPSSLRDLELHVHAGLLVAGDAAIDVVGAALQVDGELCRLPGADDRRFLIADPGPVENQVVGDGPLVHQIKG